jgi:hypothetical protein
MKVLTPHEVLELWECGSRLYPLDQALLALRITLPDVDAETIADWPLGGRNRALLELHAACFGSRLQAWVECANCTEKLEFDVDARDLLGGPAAAAPPDTSIRTNGHTFRLPSSRDLARAAQESDANQGAIRVLHACCLDGAPGAWTERDVATIGEVLAAADPAAELRLTLTCPMCDGTQEEALDPVTFVWAELRALAKRLLHDIHTLASAYGWSEPEILRLSDFRRSQYVEMARA